MILRYSLPVLILCTPLLAQEGDRPGEVQAPLSTHIEIPPAPILSPEEALGTFTVAPGFRIELVAADPLVHDPVAMTFGPDGRLWVVEMRGFMLNADGTNEDAPVGSIAVLKDTNGDGRMDQRIVFVDGLVLPRTIALVEDGAIIAEPPHLWFYRDTSGNGVADTRTLIASDYGIPANPEHSANGLMRALDNWMYNAKSDIRYLHTGGGDLIREETIARGQWGITQDNQGRIYYNSNSDPLRMDVIPSEYLARNPHLINPDGVNLQLVPNDLRIWPGRVTPGVNRGYQILDDDLKIRAMTAASAPTIYRDTLFPGDFMGNAFVPEPSANLVKRIIVEEENGTLKGRNAYKGAEFLTSTDERFRPVFLTHGPDGALYIVDMYRGILQHRIFLTSFLRQQIEERELDQGIGLGRIYRIVPEDAPPPPQGFDLSSETSARLVERLTEADSWWRDTAQRILVERRDAASIDPLRSLARSQASAPLARLHALWTLRGIEQLDRETVLAAMDGTDVRVTAAAMRLSEPWLAQPGDSEIFQHVTTVMNSSDGTPPPPAIILQRALSLGEARSPAAFDALMDLASRNDSQPFLPEAVISGLAGRELEFIRHATSGPASGNAVNAVTLAAGAVLGSGEADKITDLLGMLEPAVHLHPWARQSLLNAFDRFALVPRRGRAAMTTLPVEPSSLITLATRDNEEGQLAADILTRLRWPGKPGQKEIPTVRELTPEQTALFEKGRETYEMLCAACHQVNGQGLPGLASALVNSPYTLGSEQAAVRIVLGGRQQEMFAMPPLGAALDDTAIAGVLTYIRRAWGHTADPVDPSTVAAIRRDVAGREAPWTDEELQQFME